MLQYIKKEFDKTFTENMAVTSRTTGSDCLDLFSTIGALRQANEEEIISRFIRAYTENPDTAMKLLFFARDIRGGLGERRVFRIIMNWLAINKPNSARRNIEYIAEYGRYDDLMIFFSTECEKDMLEYVKRQFDKDMLALKNGGEISLLAKWLPSINATNKETIRKARLVARALGLNNAEYRKALTALRAEIKILEDNLRRKDYSFDYEKQPSRAMFKYRKAFFRNDSERYMGFLSKVCSGKAVLHTDNVSPYELIDPYLGCYGDSFIRSLSEQEKIALNTTWENIPDFAGDENTLVVVDTSASMYWTKKPSPASVALSLGLYFAERNKGVFKNHFIEFSETPRLIEIKGDTFVDKLSYIATFNEIANTNLEAVFDLLLNAAVKNNVSQNELPQKLIIISDMEFDCCIYNSDDTNFNNAKNKYNAYGYKLPSIVFWNVASRNRQQPVTENEQGVVLVSGVTPRLFSMVAGGALSPYKFMIDVIESERYSKIVA